MAQPYGVGVVASGVLRRSGWGRPSLFRCPVQARVAPAVCRRRTGRGATPLTVSGGDSKQASSTSSTSPISSTSKLVGPSSVRMMTFMGSVSAERSLISSRRPQIEGRDDLAARFINPLTTRGARGTRVNS